MSRIFTAVTVVIVVGMGVGVVLGLGALWLLSPWLAFMGLISLIGCVVSFKAWWRRRPDDPWERDAHGRGWDIGPPRDGPHSRY